MMKKIDELDRDLIYRFLVYRKPGLWTPFEQENKYMDETIYEDVHYEFGKIHSMYETNSGDIYIMFEIYDPDNKESYGKKQLYNLNEIRLSIFDYDNKDGDDD